MALIVATLLVALTSTAYGEFFGGASSVAPYAADIVSAYNAKFNPNVPAFISTSSGDGLKGFLNGTLDIAASTDPLNNVQDALADRQGGKLTIPLTLATFNIMTKKAANLKLTPRQVALLYESGGIVRWNQIAGGLSGLVTAVARGDSAGATEVISQWLRASGIPWIVPSTNPFKNGNGIVFKAGIVFKSGNSGVANYLAGNPNSIGYIQTGFGVAAGLYQTAIKNLAKNFIFPSQADPTQSIPRVLPVSSGNWAAVNLLNQIGKLTYPINSFVYLITAKNAGSSAAQIKQFLAFTQTDAVQNLVNNGYSKSFFRLPPSIVKKNLAAIKTITA